MSYDLLNDWDDTPEDEKEALLVLKTYHHLVYQLFHMDYLRSVEIIRQHCNISAYFEKHIKSGATPKECNDRILTFLEDRFSRNCEYDEFITILRNLVDMPHAQTILDQMQKKLNECFAERKKKEKLQATGVTETNTTNTSNTTNSTTGSTTSDTVSVVDSKAKPVKNTRHQPTTTVVGNTITTSTYTSPPPAADTGASGSQKTSTATANQPTTTAGIKAGGSAATGGAQERSAKNVMSSIINGKLHSTPGFDILDSYKDRVCDSLPADYNTTAVRLQTLIGASDYMVQWVLTGDMSQVNHRIYQIVLVYVWCQPHFIKFCDIMEVLADDSMTAGHIKALRKDLIRHLYSDGHITAEEASHLESKKLFQAPTASPPTAASGAATASVIHTTPLSSDAVTRSTRSTSATNPASAVLNLIKDMSINYQSVASTGSTLNAVTTTATIAGQSTTASFSKSTTASLSQIPLLAGQVSQTISTASQPAITITPNTPLSLPQGASLRTGVLKLTTTTNQSSLQQSSLQLTDQGLPQTDNLTVGGDTSQPTSSLASSENGDSNDDHYYDDMTFDPSPEPDVVPSDNGNQATASKPVVSIKTQAVPSREMSPVATMQAHSTSGGDHGVTVVLTPAGVGSSQSDMNQLINAIVDNGQLSYDQIASFLLSSQQERSIVLMKIMKKVKEAQTEASAQAKPVTTPKRNVDQTALAEVEGIFKNPDFATLKARYAEILACFPESFEATVNVLQEVLDPSQIWEILSATSGHNQKILNALILKMNSKEDMLDFCDNLGKIPGVPPLLMLLIDQLRKDVIDQLQNASTPAAEHKPLSAPELPQPQLPDPFEKCLLPADSERLTAMKTCYPVLIKNLPSQHMVTLSRLLEMATIPEELMDSLMTTTNSEVGNKMIINYLISLVHTEEHIITFCNFAEKMIGDPVKCGCVLNLRNVALMAQQSSKMNSVSTTSVTTSTDSKPTTSVSPAPTDPPSTSKHGDSDKRHDHPTTFTDDDDDNLKKPSASKMATFQSEATDNDDFKKPSASKMASSQSKSNTFTDDDDLKKPSRMASSQSESGGTQLDKPPVTSQASGGSEISQKSSVVGNKVVTQSSTTHQTVTDLESSAAESYMPLVTKSSPEDDAAAVNAFNECRPQLETVDPEAVTRRLIQTDILSKDCDVSQGAAVQLPNEVKRQLIWSDIGRTIQVSGAGVFHRLVTILNETPNCFDTSTQLYDAYERYKNPLAAAATAQHNSGTQSDSVTSSGAYHQAHHSQKPEPSHIGSAKVASNNLGMPSSSSTTAQTTLEPKTNWLSGDPSGTSVSFSQDDKVGTTTKTVPQQVSDSDETTAGSGTYSGKLATTSVVSSIASTEGSMDTPTLEAYEKEDGGATVATDEMTTNNLSDSPASATTVGGGASFSPVSTKKCQQSGAEFIPLPDTTAAMEAFDEYTSLMQNYVDPFVFIPKCISYELLSGDVSASGGSAVFLTNEVKMAMVLPEIRNNIFLNGVEKFFKLTELFRSEPIYNELANHLDVAYQKFKDPAELRKHKEQAEMDLAMDKATAVQEDPIKTNAALKTFDEYYSMIHEYVDVTMMTSKCVGYGVIPERSPITGASLFLPDMMKMEMVLPLIRKNIALNGVKVFFKFVKVFQSMGYYTALAAHLEAAYQRYEQGIESPEPSESLPSASNADHLTTQQQVNTSSVGRTTGSTDTSVKTKQKVQDDGEYSEKGHL